MRAVALACCLAILIAPGISAEGAEKPAARATQRLDAEALELSKLVDGGGFFARIGRGLELSLKEDVELPRLLLAKHHSNRPETKALLLHAVDQILTRRAPKLNQFPLAWAKEDLAERRWTAALRLATHDPELFDLDARKLYLDALRELWKDAQAANPALKREVFPRVHHEEWQRGDRVRFSSLGATVVARHYTPRSAIVGSVLLCDTLDLDPSVGGLLDHLFQL